MVAVGDITPKGAWSVPFSSVFFSLSRAQRGICGGRATASVYPEHSGDLWWESNGLSLSRAQRGICGGRATASVYPEHSEGSPVAEQLRRYEAQPLLRHRRSLAIARDK